MLSCVVAGSASGLYHVALWCCCWSCDGTFSVSVRFCRTEETHCLARVALGQGLGVVSTFCAAFFANSVGLVQNLLFEAVVKGNRWFNCAGSL